MRQRYLQHDFTDLLWGQSGKFRYLFLAAILLLFAFLGAREIWTQEHRWADIVSGMFYRQDFFHPYLGENNYYDKPLLSYWLIAVIAKIGGSLTTWALRLPSAVSGLLAVSAIYYLGKQLKNKQLGLLAGWLLLTTYYFIFWARTSSADMLNLAGCLFAIAWYMGRRTNATFWDYTVFFIILALTSLCKGLVGVVVPLIAVFIDMYLQKSWRYHLRPILFLALIPAIFIYLLPFVASSYLGAEGYHQSGLYLVYRENVLRYFQPFDHQGPIYTYLLYLPIYLLPWTILFIPACILLPKRWNTLSSASKWIIWVLLALFLFFTLSGSRRSYYVLPLVPFAILLLADWMASDSFVRYKKKITMGIVSVFVFLFIAIDVLPFGYYTQFGVSRFASVLKQEANQIQSWDRWQIVLLDAESKLNFYLQLPPSTPKYRISGLQRAEQTVTSLGQKWSFLLNKPPHTIYITRKRYVPLLQPFFDGYKLVELPSSGMFFLKSHDINGPAAFVPMS